jgi:hypothetical protein
MNLQAIEKSFHYDHCWLAGKHRTMQIEQCIQPRGQIASERIGNSSLVSRSAAANWNSMVPAAAIGIAHFCRFRERRKAICIMRIGDRTNSGHPRSATPASRRERHNLASVAANVAGRRVDRHDAISALDVTAWWL